MSLVSWEWGLNRHFDFRLHQFRCSGSYSVSTNVVHSHLVRDVGVHLFLGMTFQQQTRNRFFSTGSVQALVLFVFVASEATKLA